MKNSKVLDYVKDVLQHMPQSWLNSTTHRLDIYEEKLAKFQFLEQLEKLYSEGKSTAAALKELPTAFDYIRLGHPLSCLLEWVIADLNALSSRNVISFSSQTMPVLAILRKNLLDGKHTQLVFKDELPSGFNVEILKEIYGYNFELLKVNSAGEVPAFEGSNIFISACDDFCKIELQPNIDFFISTHAHLGSVALINGVKNEAYASEIQHVRRRETIAMTPANCLASLNFLIGSAIPSDGDSTPENKALVLDSIKSITNTNSKALLGSSGLSIQYAILMGLIHDAREKHKGKKIKIVVPPNCYGGTNDQARRVAACLENVEVVDLPVDGGQDMVRSVDLVLSQIASDDGIPYIIAEIPTNPRVEVPDLLKLKDALSEVRKTKSGAIAVDPVFILDQTFCPNVRFLGENEILSTVRTISYVSGSKFPSGGLCTAGYCVANSKSESLMAKIQLHLHLCGNEATDFQVKTLAKQLPSMEQRIKDAYKNTREFVDFIVETLPQAKINFVSKDLADRGFTPSVFSLDLPTKGNTNEEKETYKRELNHKLINLMIERIPSESQHCVSYGQLKGCYWTVPATSTQGTTKEGDKDYIVRVAVAPNMNVELHKKVFLEFIEAL